VGSTWDGTAPGDTDIQLDFNGGQVDPLVFELKQASGKWIMDFKGDASGRWCWHVRLRIMDKNTLACRRQYFIIYPSNPYANTCPATPALNVPAPASSDTCPTGQIYDTYESKCKDGCSAQEFYDEINKQCKKSCSSDQILDTKKNVCIPKNRCASSEFWDSSTQACSKDYFSLGVKGKPSNTTITYSVNFKNDSKILLSPPVTSANLKTYTKIFLENYEESQDFTSQVLYSETDHKITVSITPIKEIAKTTVSVHFLLPEKLILKSNGKANPQSEASSEFAKVSPSELEALESVGPMLDAIGGIGGTATSAAGTSVVIFGLFGGGLMFLVMFINVVEFFTLYLFFNVKYSFLIEAVLGTLSDALDTPLIANPLNDYNSDEMDLARIYKYKLTAREIPPWFFQNSNIEIFPVIFVYFLTIVLWAVRTPKMKKMKKVCFCLAK
jgi:hypothetical protein